MKSDFSHRFKEVEELIKEAKWKAAQQILLSLRRKPIPEECLLEFSTLARRANIPKLGLLALRPYIRQTSRKIASQSEAFRIEYAANLLRIGASCEADSLLGSLHFESPAEALFTKAGVHIKEWDYQLAIPLYRRYIEQIEGEFYDHSVARLNLSMCLIFEGHYEEAAELLNTILINEDKSLTALLKGNAYRLLGGLEFYRANYVFAMTSFQHAYAIFRDSDGLDRFVIRKWIAICNYYLTKGSHIAKVAVDGVREEAMSRRHWESIREIDFQIASFHEEEALLLKLYFGTPFQGFKNRFKKRFPQIAIPNEYRWSLMDDTTESPFECDILKLPLKPGQRSFRLFATLQSDFYRSFALVEIFEKLFPNEFYIFGSSEQRVSQAIGKLRIVLKTSEVPLTIDARNLCLRLVPLQPIEILCRDTVHSSATPEDHRLSTLRKKFGEASFSIQLASETLGLAKRTINPLIKDAIHRGILVSVGLGNKIQYRFLSNEKKAA